MTRLTEGLAGLFCLGLLATPLRPAALPMPSVLRFTAQLASTYHFAYRTGDLLVPTGIEPVSAKGVCPARLRVHFRGHDLDGPRWLQPSDMGVTRATVALPLKAFNTDQEVAACTHQIRNSRMD
jgi:hypothetical protein